MSGTEEIAYCGTCRECLKNLQGLQAGASGRFSEPEPGQM